MKMIPTRQELVDEVKYIIYENIDEPYGAGAAAEQIVDLLLKKLTSVSTGEYLNIP